MNVNERRLAICQRMAAERLDVVVGIHDATRFIETPNPVMVLSGFRSLGPAAAALDCDGAPPLIDSDDMLDTGDVPSIRVGAANERGRAIISTVVAVQDDAVGRPANRNRE